MLCGTRRLLEGGLAGLAATAPMTLVMLAMHRRLPRHERHSLPPTKITMRAARRVGLREDLGAEWQRQTATLTAHFAYGAAAGSLYSPLARVMRPPPVAGGVAFGLVVWLVSYLGLLPAVGLFPPTTRESERRNVLMIVAHVAWGAALGVLVDAWGERRPVE